MFAGRLSVWVYTMAVRIYARASDDSRFQPRGCDRPDSVSMVWLSGSLTKAAARSIQDSKANRSDPLLRGGRDAFDAAKSATDRSGHLESAGRVWCGLAVGESSEAR